VPVCPTFGIGVFPKPGRHWVADRVKVLCISKSDRLNAHERIRHIGGRTGTAWKLTQEEAIAGIEAGKWSFYVTRGGSTVDVIVATSRFGEKYLKTTADGEQPDNLLSLHECP
jgi:uncharacterized protein DUF3892